MKTAIPAAAVPLTTALGCAQLGDTATRTLIEPPAYHAPRSPAGADETLITDPQHAALLTPQKSRALLIHHSGADPWIVKHDGLLYYLHTTGFDIRMWVGDSLGGLKKKKPAVLWSPDGREKRISKNIWAPELHHIRGRWYIYFAADDGHNENHRMYVLQSRGGPLGPYELKGKLSPPGEDLWAIDGTPFELNGELFFVWSGWPGKRDGRQNLYCARMKNPWTLASKRVLIAQPEYPWESWINEGPEVLKRGNRVFLVFSANRSWTDHYNLGLLRLNGGDPLAPDAWEKAETPAFSSTFEGNPIYAPGHCSFLTDDHGVEWILYHVAQYQGAGWRREVHAQTWKWNPDGSPDFGSPRRPELNP